MVKRALVLSGGGTKGIYEVGAIEALKDLGLYDFDLVIGTSVGALNAMFLVQDEFEKMLDMYEHIDMSQFIEGYVPNPNDINLPEIYKDRDEFFKTLKNWVKDKGVDIKPFEEMVHEYFNPEKFFASKIDFGCVVATKKERKGIYVTKEMMKENGEDWLVATSSAYPVFPVKEIDGVEYIDGGYFDSLAIEYALRKGAKEIVAIDLRPNVHHPNYLNRECITYIYPHEDLYNFLNFDKDRMHTARILGYLDTMKEYGVLVGEKYTFKPFVVDEDFNDFYRMIMILEADIKQATSISGRFRSEQAITDILLNETNKKTLKTSDVFYILLDNVMKLMDLPTDEIYEYKEVEKKVFEEFSECSYEGYYNPQGIIDATSYSPTTDKKTVVKRLVHANLFPEKEIFSNKLILTVIPFEETLAKFVVYLMKEYVEEESCKK